MPNTGKMSGDVNHISLQPFGHNIIKKAPLIYHVLLECPQLSHLAEPRILLWRAWKMWQDYEMKGLHGAIAKNHSSARILCCCDSILHR